jgi:hypothetical protein
LLLLLVLLLELLLGELLLVLLLEELLLVSMWDFVVVLARLLLWYRPNDPRARAFI